VAKVGYGRINSIDESLDEQKSKLDENGCEKVFLDKQAGTTVDGPRLTEVLNYVRHGDSLVITRLDRLARSTYHLTRIAQELRDKGIDLVVLDQNIDTSTPTGKLFFDMLASIAEFEADIRKDREKWT
jgi:DNA invertase Pin-like site-specific DNA recombinase